MPLPIAHGLTGAAFVAALHPNPASRRFRAALFAGTLLANAADSDFVLVWVFHSRAWHRAFTHSLFFALLVGLMFVATLGRARLREALAYGLAYMSHGLVDWFTTTVGGGVELLWPVSSERLKLGLWGLSEVPSRMPPSEILKSLLIELAIFAPMLAVVLFVRRRQLRRRGPASKREV
jgi:membrane-bound metal-dependent hydrolase YbcI (DUF457 family)